MIVYRITNKINGKQYIGQTVKNLQKRWSEHCSPHSECRALVAAIQKYGDNNFCIEKIGSYTNMEDLNNAEQYYIEWYNTLAPNGYNLTTGGSNKRLSIETKDRIGRSNKGHRVLKKTRLKISAALKGKSLSPETKRKISLSLLGNTRCLGYKQPKSTLIKKSNSLKGNKNSLGFKHTEETKKKVSLAVSGRKNGFYGKKHSNKTKLKISVSKKISYGKTKNS